MLDQVAITHPWLSLGYSRSDQLYLTVDHHHWSLSVIAHGQVSHDITAIRHCRYSKSAIWADTSIRLIVETTICFFLALITTQTEGWELN